MSPAHNVEMPVLPVAQWVVDPGSNRLECTGARHHSVGATLTKLPCTWGLDDKSLFLTVLEAGQSKIQLTSDQASDEVLLLAS